MRQICAVLLIVLSPVVGTSRRLPNTAATRIQEARFVAVGGVQQWVTIRGADRANPVLLVVHGGPSDAQSSLSGTYAVYEKDFTIVQWDQRGAGKTYETNPSSPPEPERVESDGIELAEYLCAYLEKRKILLLGHSWGSYLAVGMVQRRPDLFAAYIGTGQVGNWRAQVQAQFDFLLSRARAAGDRERVTQLEAIGTPDPTNWEQYLSWWRIRNPYLSRADAKWFEELRRLYDGMTEEEKRTGAASGEFSMRATLSTILAEDLPATAGTLHVPFFVIQGKEDMMSPTSVAVAYFNVVKAPKKRLVLIDHAGHFALVTHRKEFLAALVRYVRPIAVERGRRAL